MTLFWIAVAFVAAWRVGMYLIARQTEADRFPPAVYVHTAQGGLWVNAQDLPKPGEAARVHAHFGGPTEKFDLQRAQRGTLTAQAEGRFEWVSSDRPRYAP